MNNVSKLLLALFAVQVGLSAEPSAPAAGGAVTPRSAKSRPMALPGGKKCNIGLTAADARFSNYGVYLLRMVEGIQLEWDGAVSAAKLRNVGGQVLVTVQLDAAGRATIARVENHSSEAAARLCTAAVVNRAPFGRWTDDMKRALADPQRLTFTFYFD